MTHQPGLPAYRDASRFPARVWRAVEMSREAGFPSRAFPKSGCCSSFARAGAPDLRAGHRVRSRGGKRAPGDPEKLLPLLVTDGLVVIGDYTPGYAKDDAARGIWLENPNYRAVEVRLAPDTSVLWLRGEQLLPAQRGEDLDRRAGAVEGIEVQTRHARLQQLDALRDAVAHAQGAD